MNSADLLVLCSSQPGFLRSLSGHVAGQCRLLECYSLNEAARYVQQHRPEIAVVDLRNAPSQRFQRSWAMAQNAETIILVAVTHANELDQRQIPAELASRVQHVEVDPVDGDLTPAVDAIEGLLASRRPRASGSQDAVAEFSLRPGQFAKSETLGGRPEISGLAGPKRIATRQPALPSIAERDRTHTPVLREMLERLEIAARHDVAILLIGETGTGKTHLARLIHESSSRREEPLLTVACGALPGDLIESELFGHVKGAFTSAHADKDGKFLAAGRGTILLDEIDVLAPEQQVTLLRVIEEGLFEPVGSNVTMRADARIIAASNLELQPLVEQGRFRADLYYRLNTLSFVIPPLRSRLPDIEPLARYFVRRHAATHGIDVADVATTFIDALRRYPWPGNIRELENAMRSAVIYCRDGHLTGDTLPPNIVAGDAGPVMNASVAAFLGGPKDASLGNRIELTEKDIIEQALLANSFSRTKTAKQLGISRVTLYNKMKKHNLKSAT